MPVQHKRGNAAGSRNVLEMADIRKAVQRSTLWFRPLDSWRTQAGLARLGQRNGPVPD